MPQQGWKHHEWDVVAQMGAEDYRGILEIDYCSLCGKWRLHLLGGKERTVISRPEIPDRFWL